MLDGYGSIINTKKLTIPTISYCPELLFYIELLNLYVFLNTLPFFGGSYFETIPYPGQSGLNFFRAYRVVVETVETVLSSFYLYIAPDLNRGLCKLPEKNGFNHLNEVKIFQTRLPCAVTKR